MDDKRYIQSLINEGEHQQQDFKYRVEDAVKLAKSVSAFANTDGGRLLIGVRDDGHMKCGVFNGCAIERMSIGEVINNLYIWHIQSIAIKIA